MNLMRQVGVLLAVVLLLALVGSIGLNVAGARMAVADQITVKNGDNAQSLALALSQQHGDPQLIELLLAAQFDTGAYRVIRLLGDDGKAVFERRADPAPRTAPRWFVQAWPLDAEAGVAQVSDGWRRLGRLEIESHTAYAHDQLWRGSVRFALWLATLLALALALAAGGVSRIRRPLAATVEQASALMEGRFVTVTVPAVPELRRVAGAMNTMVERLRHTFAVQAEQVETLRREAHEDRVTGLANRAFFMQRLASLLHDESGADAALSQAGCLLLVRLAGLASLNREIGREAADQALRTVAHELREWPGKQALAGRLNGADFAFACPLAADADAAAVAEELSRRIRSALSLLEAQLTGNGAAERPPALVVHVGAAQWQRPVALPTGALLSRADLALAKAESGPPFASQVDLVEAFAPPATVRGGEAAWSRRLDAVVKDHAVQLAAFPVLGRDDSLLHLECPLRARLDSAGAFEPAARWLPLVTRAQRLPAFDALALRLAMAAIAEDGQPRAVNLAVTSLHDGAFVAATRALLAEQPQAARQLWLELPEASVIGREEVLGAFGLLVRPLGVRLGIEHGGHNLRGGLRLYETPLDYVKLDAALLRGACSDDAVRRFVSSGTAWLHARSLQVIAEGVCDEADAQALWACGVDAMTGPWITASRPCAGSGVD